MNDTFRRSGLNEDSSPIAEKKSSRVETPLSVRGAFGVGGTER